MIRLWVRRSPRSVPSCAKRITLFGALSLVLGCEAGTVVTLGEAPPASANGGSSVSSGGSGTGGSEPDPTGGASAVGGMGGTTREDPGGLPLRFENVELVAELSSREKDDNPTLTADQLLLCFTSNREGSSGDVDVWCASRDSLSERFDEPVLIDPINSEVFETSPALSLDGLSLWFSSDRDGGTGGADIYVSHRASRTDPWEPPQPVDELNSEFDDIPRPPAMNDTVMPLASRRTNDTYFTYLASRSDGASAFSVPVLLEELTGPGFIVVDAHLSEDGLLLLFTTVIEKDAPADLYAATRTTLASPFGEPVLLEGANSDADDRDPWLSPDGQTLYFSSNRAGDPEIYRATRVR